MTVYTSPHILPVRAENIPEQLKTRPQWVVWKALGDKPDKVPYSARSGRRASSTDLLTWSTFQETLEAYENGEYAGLGFVYSSADPYTGIDLDDCVDADSEIAGWALEIVRYFDSYTELSATGTLGSAGNPAPRPGGRGRDNRAAVRSHRSRAIGGVLMPHLYKRPGNHWKTPTRFDRRETEQEESQPLRKTGTPRSLKDITKAKPRRAPWK